MFFWKGINYSISLFFSLLIRAKLLIFLATLSLFFVTPMTHVLAQDPLFFDDPEVRPQNYVERQNNNDRQASRVEANVEALDAIPASIILFLAKVLHIIATALGNFGLWIIELIVVPVLQYNSFSDSIVIGNGWSLVRDVVNMFVVLVLIVIAVSTIVGYEKVPWQKNLPQFLLAVVMVNFSRTICGLLIDVSQVIMFTFVNALLDVAAGNFGKMLGIDSFGAYSNSIAAGGQQNLKLIDAAGQLGAAFLELVLYIVITLVLMLLMLAFIWRIVVLWVLVVMSPLTFFASGVGGLFKFADSIGGEWWKKFTAALTMGPMLTFFLWLALSTATTGVTQGFDVEEIKTEPPRLLESFDNSRLLATFLGIAILIIGVQQSAASAGTLGGLAKKYLGDPKLGEKLVGGTIGVLGGNAVQRTAARTATRVGAWGIDTSQQVAAGLASSGDGLDKLVGGVIGRAGISTFGSLQQQGQKFEKARKEEAVKRVGAFTDDQLAAYAKMEAAGVGAPVTWEGSDDRNVFRKTLATDEKKRATLFKNFSDTKMHDMLRPLVNMSDAELKAIGIDPGEMTDVKSENLHLLSQSNRQKFLESGKLNTSKLSKRALSGESEEVIQTRDDLAHAIVGFKEGKNISILDKLKEGEGERGMLLRKYVNASGQPELYDSKQAAERRARGDSGIDINQRLANGDDFTVDAYAARILTGDINLSNITADQLKNSKNLVEGILQAGYHGRAMAAWRDDKGSDSRGEVFLSSANAEADKLSPDRQLNLFTTNLDETKRNQTGPEQKKAVRALANDFFVDTDSSGNSSIDVARLQAVLRLRPEFIGDFAELANPNKFGTEAGEAMLRAFNAGDIRQMGIAYAGALTSHDRDPIKANFEALTSVMQAQINNGIELSGNTKKLYDAMVRAAGVIGTAGPDTGARKRNSRPPVTATVQEDEGEDEDEDTNG